MGRHWLVPRRLECDPSDDEEFYDDDQQPPERPQLPFPTRLEMAFEDIPIDGMSSDESISIVSIRPQEQNYLTTNQMHAVIDLLGRRCTEGGKGLRATRTLVPVVQRLVAGPNTPTVSTDLTMAFGLQAATGTRRLLRELDAAVVRELHVELLVAMRGERVHGCTKLKPHLKPRDAT